MSAPVIIGKGVNMVDAATDATFRQALLAGAPPSIQPLIRRALAHIPQANAAESSRSYFGKELPNVTLSCTPLCQELEWYCKKYWGVDGFHEWLALTGYGNSHLMLKALYEWSKMDKSPKGAVPKPTTEPTSSAVH